MPGEYRMSVNNGEWKYVKGNLTKDQNDLLLSLQIEETFKKCTVYIDEDHLCVFGNVSIKKIQKQKYFRIL